MTSRVSIFNQTRYESGRKYIEYQRQIAEQHMIPLMRRLGVNLDLPILDVGCGKGGCVIAVSQALRKTVHGIDISPADIDTARGAAADVGVDARFDVVDVQTGPLPEGMFGLLLVRDVVEHLPDLRTVLNRLHRLVSAEGFVYVTFPPWRGPYAGHQHNAKSAVKFMPYLHALAPNLFLKLLQKWESDKREWLEDERQILLNRLTRNRFEQLARETGWQIDYRQTYLLRPAFMRMGLPTMPNGWVGRVPLIGECLTTACEYLLRAQPDRV